MGAAALAPYAALITGSHPEYHTEPTLDALGATWRAAAGSSTSAATASTGGSRASRGAARDRGAARRGRRSRVGRRSGDTSTARRRARRPLAARRAAAATARRHRLRRAGLYEGSTIAASPGRAIRARPGSSRASTATSSATRAFGGGAAGFELDRTDARLGTPPVPLVVASSEGHSGGATWWCPRSCCRTSPRSPARRPRGCCART